MKTLCSFLVLFLCLLAESASGTIRRVPSQYATIQSAINASVHGDTVLVSDGTYYENIRFKGKRIVVGSTYLTTDDTSHISRTIINGSQPTHPDSGSTVSFVSGEDTNSVLCGMTITGGTGTINTDFDIRVGGGVWVLPPSWARISHNKIIFNSVTYQNVVVGAGVAAGSPYSTGGWLILEENEISHNTGTGTNGVGAVGVTCGINARIMENRIEDNQGFTAVLGGAGGGMNCWTEATGSLELIVRGNVISGNKLTSTGVDQYGQSGLGGGLAISGYRAIVEQNVITDNELEGPGKLYGGGVLLNFDNDLLQFHDNWISGNRLIGGSGEHRGGGVCIWSCNPKLTNNIVVGNVAKMGGGVCVGGTNPPSSPHMVNNTICGNSATLGSGIYSAGSYPVVLNTILWNQGADVYQEGGMVTVQYSDIRGGWIGTGNIDVNPAFLDTTYRLASSSPCIFAAIDSLQIGGIWFHAPPFCIYGMARPTPAGTRPDIGACENPIAVGVKEPRAGLPTTFGLSQNYPNPFNPNTTISYQLPTQSDVTLRVFDVLGREVATLVNGVEEPGYKEVRFGGDQLASGVYFYRLQTGSFVQTKKLMLLK